MKNNEKRSSSNPKVRDESFTGQPEAAKDHSPGRGNKKLDGPNRPST